MNTAAVGHNNPPPLREILTENYAHLAQEVEGLAERANAAPKVVKNEADLDAVGVVVKDAKNLLKQVDTARKAEKEPHLQAGREIDGFFKTFSERLERIASALESRATEYQRQKAAEERRRREEEARKLREQEEEARRKAEEAAAAGRAAAAGKAEERAELLAEKAAEAQRLAEANAADLARVRGASGTLATAKTTMKVRIADYDKLDLNALKPYLDREAVQKAANTWLRVTKGASELPGLEVYEDIKATFR
jgi:hypothetical protein